MFVQERDRLVGGLVGGGSVAIEFVVSDLEAHLEGPVQPQVVRLDVLLLASDPISVVNRLELVGSTDLHSSHGRGAARAEDAQGTPTQSHISPRILVYEDNMWRILATLATCGPHYRPTPGCETWCTPALHLELPHPPKVRCVVHGYLVRKKQRPRRTLQ